MSIKNLLIEMKNMSELMVDLAYSAVLFNSKAAAEEVIELENDINEMNYEIKKESLVAASWSSGHLCLGHPLEVAH